MTQDMHMAFRFKKCFLLLKNEDDWLAQTGGWVFLANETREAKVGGRQTVSASEGKR